MAKAIVGVSDELMSHNVAINFYTENKKWIFSATATKIDDSDEYFGLNYHFSAHTTS
jgi:hypothetical protein